MVRLSVLGALDLQAPDGTVLSSILAQPKRAALLTFLALARPRGLQRRDRILAVFWPELPEDRARANLSNALYFLRRSLPAGTLASRGDAEIGVEDGRLRCDALDVEAALEEGRGEEALALYAGDLLPGFHLDDAPEWERWLDDERARMRREMVETACALAARAAEGGEHTAAAGWARRALGIDPTDEPALRGLVGALDGAGDRVGALREYDAFAARLEAELGLEPSPETRALADAVRRREAALDAPAAAGPAAAAPPPAAPRATAQAAAEPVRSVAPAPLSGRRRWPRSRWGALAIAAALVLPISSGTYTAWQRAPAHRVAPEPGRVAVLPFAVRADPGLEHLGPGIADLLSSRLDGRGSLHTIDPTALFHAAGVFGALPGDLERSGALSARFGAGQYITGSVVRAGTSIQITASVYRADGKPRARRSHVAATEADVLPAVDSLVESLLESELTDLSDTLRMIVSLRGAGPCALAAEREGETGLLGTMHVLRQGLGGIDWPTHPAAVPTRGAAAAAMATADRRLAEATAAACSAVAPDGGLPPEESP